MLENYAMINGFVLVMLSFLGLANYPEPIEFRIPIQPQAVLIDGIPTSYYEIHFDLRPGDSVQINSITIRDAIDSSIVETLNESNLKNRVVNTGNKKAAGQQNVIYIELSLKHSPQKDITLLHQFEVDLWQKGKKSHIEVSQAPVVIASNKPAILSSPFQSGVWAAVYYPYWERGHRRVFYTSNEKPCLPGRFAIDFIKLDETGRYAKHNEDSIKNWYSYGVPVLAVADGIVSNMRNDFNESLTISKHPHYGSKEATGNYISLKIAENKYVFYEHLKPGSIKVMPGDAVKKGDIIGAIGFTGQSTGPHLHLHVADTDSPLEAEGVPFIFEQFSLLGKYDEFTEFGRKPWNRPSNNASTIFVQQRPGPNSVITFQ